MIKLSMYMVTHKKLEYIPKDRIPFYVGGHISEDNYLCDDIKDNISYKNKNYCELTAFYWIWKNDNTSDYVSIEHYRRFFMYGLFRPTKKKNIINILNKFDGIQMKKHNFKVSLTNYYQQHHILTDLTYAEEAITKYYPEYLETYHQVMNGNVASMCNMLVLSKKNFDNYCGWLFKILAYVEKNIDVKDRDAYQARVFGFISERLQNVWIEYNKLNMKNLPIYFHEPSKIKSILKSIKNKF